MYYTRILIFLAALILCGESAFANRVDIGRTVYLPKIDGLKLSHPFSQEVPQSATVLDYKFSIDASALGRFLKEQNLPPIVEQVPRQVPQCKKVLETLSASFEIRISDGEWLKRQTRWCRFRRLFGACKPNPHDLYEFAWKVRAPIRMISDEKVTLGAPVIEESAGVHCTSDDYPSGRWARVDYLKDECVGEKWPDSYCYDSFEKAAFSKRDGQWVSSIVARQERALREPLPSVPGAPQTHTLTSFIFGDESEWYVETPNDRFTRTFQPMRAANGKWSSSLKLKDLLAAISPIGPDSVPFQFMYEKGAWYNDETTKVQLKIPTESVYLNNFPQTIKLRLGDIQGVERLVKKDEATEMANAIVHFCKEYGDRDLKEFGNFLCRHEQLATLLTKRIQYRFQFLDHDGVSRSLVWEHPAPASLCKKAEGILDRGFRCLNVGDGLDDMRAWLEDDTDLALLLNDRWASKDITLTFSDIERPLPKTSESPAFTHFMAPQSTSRIRLGGSNEVSVGAGRSENAQSQLHVQ